MNELACDLLFVAAPNHEDRFDFRSVLLPGPFDLNSDTFVWSLVCTRGNPPFGVGRCFL